MTGTAPRPSHRRPALLLAENILAEGKKSK
jgi:hypothetical protein